MRDVVARHSSNGKHTDAPTGPYESNFDATYFLEDIRLEQENRPPELDNMNIQFRPATACDTVTPFRSI